jgi:hypothetical protein
MGLASGASVLCSEISVRRQRARVGDGGTLSRRKRRLPGDALIEFEVALWPAEDVPIRHGDGASAQAGGPPQGDQASQGCRRRIR